MRVGDLGITVDIPVSIVDALSQKIVAAATPEVRYLIAQEKSRFSEALYKSLPFAGSSAVIFLGTMFLIPDHKIFKAVGYLLAAGLLGGAVLMFTSEMKGTSPTPAPAPAAAPGTPTASAPAPEAPKSFQIKVDL